MSAAGTHPRARCAHALVFVGALLPLFAPLASFGAELPETGLAYAIEVRLDPADRRFHGRESLVWRNPSDQAVARVPLHLYLNAFANEASSWMTESGDFGIARFDLSRFHTLFDDPWGWIELDRVVQLGAASGAPTWRPIQPDDGNPEDRTLIELTLAEPVAPGAELRLEIEFSGRMPAPFARTGCTDDFCMVGQWYPKLAAFEAPGTRGARAWRWAARQFHATTEFYADFADIELAIDVPEGWTLGATGRRQEEPQHVGEGWVRHRFAQRAVHDAAFALGRTLVDVVSTHAVPGGDEVEIHVLTPLGTEDQVPRWREAAEVSLDVLGKAIAPYPYETLTIVVPPPLASRTRGMEYPTLIVGGIAGGALDRWPRKHLRRTERTVIHEFCHQYFYGIIATNEQEEAFLDEGFATYWEERIAGVAYGEQSSTGSFLGRPVSTLSLFRLGLGAARDALRDPLLRRPSTLYEPGTYSTQVYGHAAAVIQTAERVVSRRAVDDVFDRYYADQAFRHPGYLDFLAAARDSGHADIADLVGEALREAGLPDFRARELRCARWRLPEGRLSDEASANRLRDEARRGALVTIDPGWVRGEHIEPGAVTRRALDELRPATVSDETDELPTIHECVAEIEGPGWAHLPVDVALLFEDGTEIVETWDARAPWRRYRVVAASRLVEVRVDPDDRVFLDGRPSNNSRSLAPEPRFVRDWAGWLTAASAWLASGLGLCL